MSTLLVAGVCVFVWLSLNALFAVALTRLRRRRELAKPRSSPRPARTTQLPGAGGRPSTKPPLPHAIQSAAAVLSLRGGPAAPSRARNTIRPLVDDAGDGVVRDVLLLVSELVTNSVVHGGADEATRIGLFVRLDERTVHVEVANPRRRVARIEGRSANGGSMPADTGRGLQIVEALADRWTVDEGDETRVSFELQRSHVADRREKALR